MMKQKTRLVVLGALLFAATYVLVANVANAGATQVSPAKLKNFAVQCGTSATLVPVTVDGYRTGFGLDNMGSEPVYLGDANVTYLNGYPIRPGQWKGTDVGFGSANGPLIYCVTQSAAQTVGADLRGWVGN